MFRASSEKLRSLLGKKSRPKSRSSTPRRDRRDGEGFRVVLPPGSCPGHVIRVQGPEGEVDLTVPPGADPGQTIWVQVKPSSTHEDNDPVPLVHVFEQDAETARQLAQQRLGEEMQLQTAIWVGSGI
ncbi:unnamed protein product [Effrenium voratum]|nr:unnamed protein product [Effrenium voratum]